MLVANILIYIKESNEDCFIYLFSKEESNPSHLFFLCLRPANLFSKEAKFFLQKKTGGGKVLDFVLKVVCILSTYKSGMLFIQILDPHTSVPESVILKCMVPSIS